jgi:hypothetical protein
LPSFLIAIVYIGLLNQFHISKEESLVQSGFKRIIEFANVQLYVKNIHPTKILLSLCIFIVWTSPSNQFHILKEESIDQPEFKRIILFEVVHLYDVKAQPTIIFPSFWISRERTPALNQFHILKEESIDQPEFRRIILFEVVH